LLLLSQEQKELLEKWDREDQEEGSAFRAYLDEFGPLGTQESASRFDLGSGETDD
jgi:hypothetical protein